jgi:hypothetical protein
MHQLVRPSSCSSEQLAIGRPLIVRHMIHGFNDPPAAGASRSRRDVAIQGRPCWKTGPIATGDTRKSACRLPRARDLCPQGAGD